MKQLLSIVLIMVLAAGLFTITTPPAQAAPLQTTGYYVLDPVTMSISDGTVEQLGNGFYNKHISAENATCGVDSQLSSQRIGVSWEKTVGSGTWYVTPYQPVSGYYSGWAMPNTGSGSFFIEIGYLGNGYTDLINGSPSPTASITNVVYNTMGGSVKTAFAVGIPTTDEVTFTITSRQLKCYGTIPEPTNTPAATNTAAPTITSTSAPTNTATFSITQTSETKVCRAGSYVVAQYFRWNISSNGGGQIGVKFWETSIYAGGISRDTSINLDYPGSRSIAACFRRNESNTNWCSLLSGILDTQFSDNVVVASSLGAFNNVEVTSWYNTGSTVSIPEHGYICTGSGETYVVRNQVPISVTTANSYGHFLSYPKKIPQGACVPYAILHLYDLVSDAYLSGGGLTAFHTSDDPSPYGTSVISASFGLTLPAPVVAVGTTLNFIQMTASMMTTTPWNSQGPAIFTVNNATYTGDSFLQQVIFTVSPGTTNLYMHYYQTFDDITPNALEHLWVALPLDNSFNGGVLNCDGGFEQEVSIDPWDSTESFVNRGMNSSVFGSPACGQTNAFVGTAHNVLYGEWGDSIYEKFTVPYDATIYYKFRYRNPSPLDLAWFPMSPQIYLVPDGGSPLDLVGLPGNYDPALASPTWKLVTGTVTLTAGDYDLYLSAGLYSHQDRTNAVAYDDVYFSLYPWQDDSCTQEIYKVTLMTPAPTNTGTVTPTGTITPENYYPTPTNLPTITQINQVTATLQISMTPRPNTTATLWATWTPGGPTVTPGGTGPTSTPIVDSSISMWPPWQPWCILCWPDKLNGPSSDPATWPPNDGPIIYIPYDGWSGEPTTNLPPGYEWREWSGNPGVDCTMPAGIEMIWVNKWLNYETCNITSFFSMTPRIASTAVAVPNRLNTLEPFGTMYEIKDAAQTIQKTASAYNWAATGGYSKGGVSPSNPFKSSVDAWSPGAEPFDFSPSGGAYGQGSSVGANMGVSSGPGQQAATGAEENPGDGGASYTCSSRLGTLFAGNLLSGSCYALNFMRNIGMLAWVQLFLNIVSILALIRWLMVWLNMAISADAADKAAASNQDQQDGKQ